MKPINYQTIAKPIGHANYFLTSIGLKKPLRQVLHD
jgi:hypothetical protein